MTNKLLRRRSDYFSMFVLATGIVLMLVPFAADVAGQASNIPPWHDRYIADIERRINNLEATRLQERLAVLEAAALEAAETRKLIYGLFVGLVGTMIGQVIQIRTNTRRRGSE